MMSARYSFVILHYNATDDTIECVDSVRKYMAGKDYHIVLVDNASPNGSGPLLREKYGNDNDITLILSDKNLGFSGGNNIGFAYAKQHLSPDFIVMLNNDTLLLQADFAELIESEYAESHFAVLGPKVESPGNYCRSNPVSLTERSLFYYIRKTVQILFNYVISFIGIEPYYQRLKGRRNGHSIAKCDGSYETRRLEGVQLHGCFWIFSKEYIELFDGLNAKTFLYGEEPLLHRRLIVNNLKSVYNPAIRIYHKEDASTKTIHRNARKKQLFVDKLALKANWAIICNRFTERGNKS